MSSPNLNNLIIIGAVLVYMFVVVSGLDANLVSEEVVGVLCHVRNQSRTHLEKLWYQNKNLL